MHILTPRRTVLLIGCLALALVIALVALHRSRNRQALERYKATLISQGEKLTYSELVSSSPTNSNSSASLSTLVSAAFNLGIARPEPSRLNPMKYVAAGCAMAAWKDEDPWRTNRLALTNWSDGWAAFNEQLQAKETQLSALREALRDPPPDLGVRSSLMQTPTANFVALRKAAQWLLGATLNALHYHNSIEAIENLEALTQLAQVNRDEYTLIGQMIRVAIADLALVASWEVLQAKCWTEPELLRLQNALQRVQILPGLEKAFLGERALGAEVFGGVRKAGTLGLHRLAGSSRPYDLETALENLVVYPVYAATSVDNDELMRLQAMHEAVLALRAVQQHRPWNEASRTLDEKYEYLTNSADFTKRFRYMLSLISVPNFRKALDRAIRVETQRQMAICAIALQRHHLLHGTFPEALRDLTLGLLPLDTFDPFSGGQLSYRLQPNGKFLLYSVGEDAKDDGGDSTPASGGEFDLWKGRDAVWPEPVP